MKKLTTRIVSAVLVLAMTFTLTACGSKSSGEDGEKQQVTRVKMGMVLSATSQWYPFAEQFASSIKERTNGAYEIDIYPSDSLAGGSLAKSIENIQNNVTQIQWTSPLNLNSMDQRLAVFGLPWLISSTEQADAIRENMMDDFRSICADNGIYLLAMGEAGYRQLSNNVRPVSTPEDLKGLSIRVPGVPMYVSMFKLLGADPVSIDFSELYDALQKHTIDGQENALATMAGNKIEEVQKYVTMWNYSYDPFFCMINPDFWNGLDAETQEIFESTAVEVLNSQIEDYRKTEQDFRKSFEEKGVQFVDLTAEQLEAFKEAAAPLYDEYESIVGADLMAKVRSYEVK